MGRYAIFLVLTMTFALITYGIGLQSNLNTAQEQMVDDYNFGQARNVAQTATMIAVNKLQDSNDNSFTPNAGQTFYHPGQQSFDTWSDMNGKYRIEVQNQGDTLITVTTLAQVDGQEFEVEVQMSAASSTWNPDLPFAVFSGSGISLTGSSRIVGHAGTNATTPNAVDLSWATKIDSSLLIGPGGDPNTVVNEANFQNGNVGKSIGNLPAPADYPLPEFPSFPAKNNFAGKLKVSAWPPMGSQPPSAYSGVYFDEIRITGNATLTLQTNGNDQTLHVGDLDIQQGHLEITGGGNVDIYVEDELNLKGSSTLNDNRSKELTFVYHKGTGTLDFQGATSFNAGIYTKEANIALRGSGGIQGNIITGGNRVDVYGAAEANTRALYAPNALVDLRGSGRVSGAVVADDFQAVGNARVTYSKTFDSELPDLQSSGGGNYDIAYWN